MKKLCISAAMAVLNFIYLFYRPAKLQDQAVIISRQSDTPSLDILRVAEGLEQRGIKTAILCKKFGGVGYIGEMLRQMKKLSTCKVVILDGYCILASILPKKEGQSIIQMWHALGAIKKFGWQSVENPDGHSREVAEAMKMHRNYDYILAPGTVTGKFFAEGFRADEKRVVLLGLPRIDFIQEKDEEKKAAIEGDYPVITQKENVLYVPTFRKRAALELEELVNGFDFDRFNLIIKKHFLDQGDYSWAVEKGAIVDSKYQSVEWLRLCEKVVTDYSAMAFEAAILDRELYIYQPDASEYGTKTGLNVDMEKEAISDYVCNTAKELFDTLAKEYDKDAIIAFKKKYLEIDMNDCTGQLCDFVKGLL